jgi:uncharacterized protein YjbJ (UPF0337 family)
MKTSAPSPTSLKIRGDWNIAKGKLKQKYAKLTDNDLRYEEGKEDEFFGRLEKATGEQRAELEKFLKQECGC